MLSVRRNPAATRLATAALASVALLGLAACGSGTAKTAAAPSVSLSAVPVQTTSSPPLDSAAPTESATPAAPASGTAAPASSSAAVASAPAVAPTSPDPSDTASVSPNALGNLQGFSGPCSQTFSALGSLPATLDGASGTSQLEQRVDMFLTSVRSAANGGSSALNAAVSNLSTQMTKAASARGATADSIQAVEKSGSERIQTACGA